MEAEFCIRNRADITQINRCIGKIAAINDDLDQLSSVLALAGNPIRLRILYLLHEEKRLCVCDLSDVLGMTVSAVSQHLKRLKDQNLVQTEKEAQTVFYSLTENPDQTTRRVFISLISKLGIIP